MSISTYSELQTAISNFINRDDISGQMGTFVALAESRIVRDLKTSELELTTTMTVDAQTEALPNDFSGMVRAHLGGTYGTLDYVTPDNFHTVYASSTTGRPIAYTIEGNNILFAPTPDTSYTMTYTYVQKPDLAVDLTNRLLTIYPDLYLWACLVEAADYVQDIDSYARYEGRYAQAIAAANESNQYKGPLSMKISDIV